MNKGIYAIVAETHQLLDQYIEIHDELIASPKGIIAILKKIFKPIKFCSYSQGLNAIYMVLSARLLELEVMDNHSLSENEFQLKQILIQYILDLREAVEKLIKINQNSEKWMDGKTYSIWAYKRDLKEYQVLIDSYSATGLRLNQILKGQEKKIWK